MPRRGLTLPRGRRLATTASPWPPERLPRPRPPPGPPPTGRPTALRNARSRPTAPPRAGPPQVPGPPTQRRAGCRRSRSHPRPGPGQTPGTRDPSRESQGLLARPVPRGCRVRRGPRPRRPTSAARGRAKRAKAARGPRGARPGLLCRVAAGRAALAGSAQAPPRAVPTRRVRPGWPEWPECAAVRAEDSGTRCSPAGCAQARRIRSAPGRSASRPEAGQQPVQFNRDRHGVGASG